METLHIVLGLPAAGKTSFAKRLAQQRTAAFIDIDIATEPVIQAAMDAITGNPDDRDSPTFKSTFRGAIYDTLFAIADSNLQHIDTVITGPFTRELENPHWIRELTDSRPAPCKIKAYYLFCQPEIRRERMKARANPRDLAKLQDWKEHEKYYPDRQAPAFPHAFIDTSEPDAIERFFK